MLRDGLVFLIGNVTGIVVAVITMKRLISSAASNHRHVSELLRLSRNQQDRAADNLARAKKWRSKK